MGVGGISTYMIGDIHKSAGLRMWTAWGKTRLHMPGKREKVLCANGTIDASEIE